VLPKLLSQAERKESKLTVALVDVDDLKVINDTKGHRSGDAMLQQFADFLKDNIRSNDIVARWGGDEFLIIAPFTDGTCVEPLIQRLRGSAKSADIPFDFSVGTATFPDDAKDLNELVKIADLNMYREKRTKKERSLH
jgi:diguanylate cyclase (GGDEF)-like protein